MNNIALSFLIMFILIISGYLIGSFFDVGLQYYMPFLLWLLALCIFNMFLDKQHVNIYMKKIELSKDSSTKKRLYCHKSNESTKNHNTYKIYNT
jgi:hypothetical protein